MVVKKLILNIILVALVVFLLDFAVGKALRYFYFKEVSGLHYRTTYSLEQTKAELLIFGASRANHHYVPEIFEDSLKLSYYNTGRDGNAIFFQTAVLRSVLKRYTPKVIILEFSGSFMNEVESYDRLSSLLPYYKTHNEIKEIVELRGPFEKIKQISQVYPFNSELATIAIGNLEFNKKRKSDSKGYVALYNEWQPEIDSIDTSVKFELDRNKINSFRDFIKTAKKSGAKVYVIYSPVFLKFDIIEDIEICREICSFENVPFWDFSKDTLFLNNNNLFQDELHLNHNGALEFSKLIVDKVKYDLNSSALNTKVP